MKKGDLLDRVFLLFGSEDVSSVIYYGNTFGSDIDLLVILKKDQELQSHVHGHWDIAYLGERQFLEGIENFSPIITEPVMTGRMIFGEGIEHIKRRLLSRRVARKHAIFIRNQAREFFEWSLWFVAAGKPIESMQCLSFCVSHIAFANAYCCDGHIRTLAEVKEGNLGRVIKMAKHLSRNPSELSKQKVIQVIFLAKRFLGSSS